MQRLLLWAPNFINRYQNGLGVFVLAAFTLVLSNHLYIGNYRRYFIHQASGDYPQTAVVLGGGIKDGQPKPVLRGRLDTVSELFHAQRITQVVVSGDNRTPAYNEPQVMKNYLVNQKAVPADRIVMDYAGRSTYETCQRAKEVFGLSRILLISESTHLPRAIYLCRTFGIEAYGAPSVAEAAKGLRIGQRWREFLASQKAFINVHIAGEPTVLGERQAI